MVNDERDTAMIAVSLSPCSIRRTNYIRQDNPTSNRLSWKKSTP